MSENSGSGTSSGVGFVGFLTLLFIGLRLAHVIDWSWWWVLSPLWIAWGAFLVVLVILLAVAAIAAAVKR